LAQATLLIKAVLPMKIFDFTRALTIVRYYQRRNYGAYLAHRKKKLKKYVDLAL
jgi:hypothetical protein